MNYKDMRGKIEIITINGISYHVFKAREGDILYSDNPKRVGWYALELVTRDMPVIGVRTKQELLEFLRSIDPDDYMNGG